ncbi:LysR family transcriptional regulator [Labrys sp. WJW]|uniref:LysR family transcriptional regulator n=1 Tax=Labrys sp. WJW TaxID=1737983 RepID=UPI00083103CC|nr:LysR family transcriptional regulator [Labrys sp. WJW]OCC01506.1 LysR family transcriptional regulator [Labrys sp. WJW]
MKKDTLVDLSLLRVFCILMSERSVSRAAVRLEMSQPAVSLVLGRLREHFGDQLLMRGRGGMVPTDRALTILPRIQALLMDAEALAEDIAPFDISASNHSFTIASPDYLAPIFLGDVIAAARREAPNVRLVIRALGPDFDFESALAKGEIDTVIGNWPSPPNYLRRSVLLEDEVVCVMGAQHRLAHGPITQADYLAAAHIVPVSYSVAHRGLVETHLSRQRLVRERTVALSYFGMAPYLLLESDLIFTTSRHFARYFAAFLPLAIRNSPIRFPAMTFYQLWHERSHHAPTHRWLRDLMARSRSSIDATRPTKSEPRA